MKSTYVGVLAAATLACVTPSFAANVAVPNGAFTDTTNDGTIGGGLLALSGASIIGSGPWSGTYNAALGILAPPSLHIQDDPSVGHATISGLLAGTDILGDLADTSGWFQQSLVVGYVPNTVYTLQANVTAASLLSVSALDNFGAGIALMNGASIAAASTDPSQLVTVGLLSGSTYQVTLQFTTGASAPGGNIGIRLFDDPSGVATAGLLQSVTFSNVTLDASPLGSPAPEPGTLLLVGAGLLALTKIRKMRRL
jgi:hypothetical protein